MTEVRRIGPEDGFLREFTEFRDRVKSLETKPSGNIVIRETLTTEDPVTGVKTTIGQLPDGSYGFQPFIGDIVPPPVATQPVVSAQPGIFTVSWDGLFVGNEPAPHDFQHVNVIGHHMDGTATLSSITVGVLRLATDTVIVAQDIAAIGDSWQFSLESEDYNGNLAVSGARSASTVMLSTATDQGVTDALAAVQADADAAALSASAAQTSANNAQTSANSAAADAATAAGIANGKGKVITQSTAPVVADQNANNLWIDTTGGLNTPKRWNGTAWVAVTDKVATDAAAAAAAAQTKADQAFNNAATAATAAGTAQTTADGKNRVWYQTTAPAGTSHKTGDTWFDTDDGNRVYLWTGSAWVDFRDAGIAAAQSTANTALTSANGKNKVYYQTTMPTGGTYILGDTWFDTDDGNKIYVHNGTTFVASQDTAIAAAQTTANTANTTANSALTTANLKTKTYFQTAQPGTTGNTVGDMWFDTDDSNKVYVWNGSSWASARDAGIASAASAAATAQTSADSALSAAQAAQAVADGSIRTFYQSGAPTGLNDTTNVGDLWFDTDDGQAYRWNGTAWVIIEDNSIAAALAAAQNAQTTADGKITSYYQPGQPATGEVGDLWFDTDDKNKPYYCSSIGPVTWTAVRDGTIADAQTTANSALTSANGKNTVFYQTAAPSTSGRVTGDTWFDTDDGNKIYVWNGTAWTASQDTAIAAAQTTANSKTKTFIQSTAPTATTVGDIWIDTATGNVIKTWEGSSWVTRADAAIATAQTQANTALTSANGKNKVYYQTTMPTGGTYILGDTWFDTDDGNKIYVHNGTTFVASQDTAIAAAQSTANTAVTNAATAQTTANAKTKTYFQTASPGTTGNTTGDIWFDTDDGNKVYVWNGTAWTVAQDAAIAAAQTSANGKNTTFYQTAAPSTSGRVTGDTWFDTDDGNKIYVWNGSAWTVSQDATIATAQTAANSAQTTANSKTKTFIQSTAPTATTVGDIWIDTATGNVIKTWEGSSWVTRADAAIATAQTQANTALTSANGKNKVYYQTTMPTGGTYILGDTWFDTDDGNKIYVHNGTTFVASQDTAIAAAQTTANTANTTANSALTTANSKTKTYFQTASPGTSGNTTGDIWFDTDDGNKPYVWNGTAWADARDATIATAQSAANGKNRIYYQTAMPTGGTYIAGDTWFDTDDGYKIYVHNGTTFTASALGASAIADLSITNAKIADATITSAKIGSVDAGTITVGTLSAARIGADTITASHIAADAITANELAANSITAAKGQISDLAITTAKIADAQITTAKIANLAVTDAQIASATITSAKIAALDAGKITSGTIDANRIGANSITANKIMVGDFTNLAADGNFVDTTKLSWTGSGTVTVSAGQPNRLRIVTAASGNNDQPNVNTIQVTPGEQIYGEVWVYGEPANVGNGAPNMHMAVTDNTGAMSWPTFQNLTRAGVSGAWTKLAGKVTMPANAKTAKVELAVTYSADAIGNIYYFREVSVRRMATGSLIVDGAIQAGSAIIATGAIGTAQIGDAQITTAKIANLAVTDAQIASATITSAKIANLDAAKITTGTLDANRIGADTITASHIAADAITANELAANSITAAKGQISDLAITTAKIADAQITTAKIANLAVTDAQIASATITSAKIAALDAGKITSGTIDANRIAAGSISAVKLQIGDFENLASINEVQGTTVSSYGQTQVSAGYNTLVNDSGSFFMFKDQTGPVPFLNGDRIYYRFVAKATVATTAPVSAYIYNAANANKSSSTSAFNIGTTDTLITGSVLVPSTDATFGPAKQWVIGLSGVANKGIAIKEVVVRRMNGGELLVDGAIQAGSAIIATGAIGTAQIGDAQITTAKIANLAVTDAQIASATITSAKIANLDAAKITTGTLDANRIGADTITASHIAADAITANELAANSITAAKGQISDLAITTAKIADAAITNAKIVDATIQYAKIGSVDAGTISVGTLNAARIGAGTITTSHMTAGTINASVLTAGSITASKIAAKTITTDKLVITSTDNLVVEANFGNNGSSWTLAANSTINATAGRGSLPAMRFTGTISAINTTNLVNRIAVGAEDRFRASLYVKSSAALVADKVKLMIRCYTTATAYTDITAATNALLVVNTWTMVSGISPTLPANTIAIEFYLSVTNDATGTITDIDYVAVTRAADGKLVVDGAIDGKTITGATIIGGEVKTTAVSGDITARMGPQTVWDPLGGTTRAGIGFSKIGSNDSYPTGLYSTDGYTLQISQSDSGGAGGSRVTLGGGTLGADQKATMYGWGGVDITGRSGIALNPQVGQVNVSGTLDAYAYKLNGVDLSAGVVQTLNVSGTLPTTTLTTLTSYTNMADASTTTSLFTLSGGDIIATQEGVYDIFVQFAIGAGATGRSFVEIVSDADTYGGARSAFAAGEDTVSATLAGLKMIVGEKFSVKAYATLSGGSINMGATVRIKKVAAPVPVGQWSQGNLTLSGDLTVSGKAYLPHRRVEFTTTGFSIAGGGTSWDTGPAVMDTSSSTKTTDTGMCGVGPYAGSITFNESGYYQVSCFVIPNSNPGDGWLRLNHSNGESLLQVANNSYKWETYGATIPVYFAATNYIRSQVSFGTAHTANTRWKIVKVA